MVPTVMNFDQEIMTELRQPAEGVGRVQGE